MSLGLQRLTPSSACRKFVLDKCCAFRCPGPSSPHSVGRLFGLGSPRQLRPRQMQRPQPSNAAAPVGGGGSGSEGEQPVTLAVVGDVHGLWDADSEAALHWLGADVAVFLGDFGEEDCQLVQRIAAVRHPRKAIIEGNHDAWYSLTARGRERLARKLAQAHAASAALPAVLGAGGREGGSAAVTKQLELLGDSHVGFRAMPFPELGLAVVGARPFSKGGKQWSDVAGFYSARYGVGSPAESAARIVAAAEAAPAGACRVVVAHNGPSGLGSRARDICGVDWMRGEGDHGDPDLEAALEQLAARGSPVPLVLFGHMHDRLRGGGRRNMAAVDPASGTVYVNCAVVPRIREFVLHGATGGEAEAEEERAAGDMERGLGEGLGSPREDDDMNGAGGATAGAAQQEQEQQQQQAAQEEEQPGVASPTKRARREEEGDTAAGAGAIEADANKRPRGAARSGVAHATAAAAAAQQEEQQRLQRQLIEGRPPQEAEQHVRGHHFVLVELLPRQQLVLTARNVWVGVSPASSGNGSGMAQAGRCCFQLFEEGLVALLHRPASSNGSSAMAATGGEEPVYEIFEAHLGSWRTVVCGGGRRGDKQPGQQPTTAGGV